MSRTTRVDQASRLIHAPAARIYQAFADPAALERWLPPRGMRATMLAFDFREGGAYRMRLTYVDVEHGPGKTSDDADEVAVRFGRLVPDRLIEQRVTFASEDPAFDGEMRISWSFEPREAGTIVTVRCDDVPAGIAREDHQAALESSLRNLAELVEGG